MIDPLPPLDAHAHIAAGIHPDRIVALRAATFAVTRSVSEWDEVRHRSDPNCVWGIGVHPGRKAAVAKFDAARFRTALDDVVFVGEVGLERHSPVTATDQKVVFDAILGALTERPRPVSIHSRGRTDAIIEALAATPTRAAILHWWTGDPKSTATAVAGGCYFSVNVANATPQLLDVLPKERILTETDFPFTGTADNPPKRPGDMDGVEALLEGAWSMDRFEVRQQLWRNLRALLRDADTPASMLPRDLQLAILTAG